MDERNEELLCEVIENRLMTTLDSDAGGEEAKKTFDEAMQAIDRSIELTKLENSVNEQLRKEIDSRKESKKDRIIKIVEIGCAAVVGPMIGFALNKSYAKMICGFEKDYTFTTTPGRTLSQLFRFKK